MKKVILLLVVVLVVWGGYNLSQKKLDLGFLQAKTETVGRGDLTIPITGTGEIEPKSRSEIKPEASGEVVDIPVEVGQMVAKGTVIIKLDPEDEQRSVTRALTDVEKAKATLEKQKLALTQRKTASLASIDAQLKGAEATLVEAKFSLEKTERIHVDSHTAELELIHAQVTYDKALSQVESLKAERKQAEIMIDLAEQDVVLAEKTFESTQTVYNDALERLRETEITAPIDGMISRLDVEEGEVVQGGKTTFTGGTILAVVADISDLYVRTEVSDADIGAVLWLAAPKARPGGEDLARELKSDEVQPMVSTSGVVEHINAEGTPVKINVDSFRDETFEGVIERIYPEPKKVQNIVTYLVDIRVTSPNRKKLALVLGMQADVEFTAEAVHNVILVPHEAIRTGPSGELGVWVKQEVAKSDNPQDPDADRKFVPCRFGLDNGLYAELIEGEGIVEGTEVFTKLPIKLDSDEEEE